MKKALGLSIVLAVVPAAHAADIEAGKAKATAVCAACHGTSGVSVSDTIPNLAAQRAGYLAAQLRALKPEGSMLLAEVYAAKLGADGQPLTGSDGFYVADKLLFYTAMASGAGWGRGIPEMLRNGDWNYAIFTLDKQHRPGVNQAECLACHKPLDNTSYVFTLKELAAAR